MRNRLAALTNLKIAVRVYLGLVCWSHRRLQRPPSADVAGQATRLADQVAVFGRQVRAA